MLAVTTAAVVRVRNLFAVAVLTSIYSFLMATVLLVLDAPDVALTEAAVGAGVGTVLLLGALYLTRTDEARPVHGIAIPLFVAIGSAAVLIYGVSETPPFGAPGNPIHSAGPDYIARSLADTGIANVVSSVLASYRGYDTLGETVVIFTAGIAVLMLLKRPPRRGARCARRAPSGRGTDMRLDVILRVAAKLILPFMLLFAIYIQFHGDYSPGGGFQAGTIAGAGVILYALVFGLAAAQRVVPPFLVETFIPLGVFIYAAVGVAGLLTGGNFLEYNHLAHDPIHGQEWGVFLVEAGVFITVAATMVAIFYAFAGRRR